MIQFRFGEYGGYSCAGKADPFTAACDNDPPRLVVNVKGTTQRSLFYSKVYADGVYNASGTIFARCHRKPCFFNVEVPYAEYFTLTCFYHEPKICDTPPVYFNNAQCERWYYREDMYSGSVIDCESEVICVSTKNRNFVGECNDVSL
jgi:hypothetical protein